MFRLKSRSYGTQGRRQAHRHGAGSRRNRPSLRYANAKINRTQRSTAQGGQADGGFGNQGNTGPAGQAAPQEDPWATPATSGGSGGWGNGPESEPPF